MPEANLEKKVSRYRFAVVFWLLIAVFILIIAEFASPLVRNYLRGYPMFASWIAFFLLGALLLFLVRKESLPRKLKKSLLLTGGSAVAFLAAVLLHNLFYALAQGTKHLINVNYLMKLIEGSFFIVGTLLCPLLFLIGIIGTIVRLPRKK